MRRKVGMSLAAVALAAAAVPVVATSASASPGGVVCHTRDATPLYAYSNFTSYLFTLSPGRGFRVHQAWGEDDRWIKFYGHGAERPDRDGWVRAQHIRC